MLKVPNAYKRIMGYLEDKLKGYTTAIEITKGYQGITTEYRIMLDNKECINFSIKINNSKINVEVASTSVVLKTSFNIEGFTPHDISETRNALINLHNYAVNTLLLNERKNNLHVYNTDSKVIDMHRALIDLALELTDCNNKISILVVNAVTFDFTTDRGRYTIVLKPNGRLDVLTHNNGRNMNLTYGELVELLK